jgi:hypothetical protein
MTFYNGTTTADDLVNLIADQLIATGAWIDADPVLDGTDTNLTDVVGAERVVAHATDANFYVYLSRRVSFNGNTSNARFNEVRVQVSSGWDAGAHAPTGTIYTSGIPLEAWNRYSSSYPYYSTTTTGSGNKSGQFWAWVDDFGFTVLSTWDASGFLDYTSIFNLERNSGKEYSDGYTNFFHAAYANTDPEVRHSNGGTYYRARYFENAQASSGFGDLGRAESMRPFNQQGYSLGSAVKTFFAAFKSDGNSKVYFQFPFYSNNQDSNKPSLIAQTDRWFIVGVSQGLADGDLVDFVNGAEVWKYLVKTPQSPDSTAYLPVAIRYA